MEKLLKKQLLQVVRDYNLHVLIPNYHKMKKNVLVNEMNKHLAVDEATNKFMRKQHSPIDIKKIEKKKKVEEKKEVVVKIKKVSEETKKRVAELKRKREEDARPKKEEKVEEVKPQEGKTIKEYEKEIENTGTIFYLVNIIKKLSNEDLKKLENDIYKKYSELRKKVRKGLTTHLSKLLTKDNELHFKIQDLEAKTKKAKEMVKKFKLQEEKLKVIDERKLLDEEIDKYEKIDDKLIKTKLNIDDIFATHEYIHNLYEDEHDKNFEGMGMVHAHLINLSLPQLYEICRKYNLHNRIRGYSKLKKIDLINKMKPHLAIENNKVVINSQNEKLEVKRK